MGLIEKRRSVRAKNLQQNALQEKQENLLCPDDCRPRNSIDTVQDPQATGSMLEDMNFSVIML